jgi:hypothetical protein
MVSCKTPFMIVKMRMMTTHFFLSMKLDQLTRAEGMTDKMVQRISTSSSFTLSTLLWPPLKVKRTPPKGTQWCSSTTATAIGGLFVLLKTAASASRMAESPNARSSRTNTLLGYLPAEHIETPTERLARLNKHRNIDVSPARVIS